MLIRRQQQTRQIALMPENSDAIFSNDAIIYRAKTGYVFFCKQFDVVILQNY